MIVGMMKADVAREADITKTLAAIYVDQPFVVPYAGRLTILAAAPG